MPTPQVKTLHDLAQEGGVSVATVSRVLNKKDLNKVSPSVRKHILKLIRKYNYAPNIAARHLVLRKSHLVGVQILSVREPSFIANLVNRLCLQLETYQYDILLGISNWSIRQERLNISKMMYKGVDGVIVMPARDSLPVSMLTAWRRQDKPLIAVHRPANADYYVTADQEKGGWMATNYLLDRGHQEIAMLAQPDYCGHTRLRIKGYRRAIQERGLTPRLIPLKEATPETAYRAAVELLRRKQKATALFLDFDDLALGVYKALKEKGMRIGKDLAIIGFDNYEFGAYLEPPLTSVSIQEEMMGRAAADLFIKRINHDPAAASVIIDPVIIARQSCGE